MGVLPALRPKTPSACQPFLSGQYRDLGESHPLGHPVLHSTLIKHIGYIEPIILLSNAYKGSACGRNRDAKTARNLSRKSARNHYLGALYHDAFYGSRKGTTVGRDDDCISTMNANTLIRNSMAMIHLGDDGTVYLGATKTGSKIYDASQTFTMFNHYGVRSQEVISYPRYERGTDIDIMEIVAVINTHFSGILRRL